MDESMIITTALFDPSFIGRSYEHNLKERDWKSYALKEVNLAQAEFISHFHEGDVGEDELFYLRKEARILYGSSVFEGLWLDYLKTKERSVLEYLRRKKIIFMAFFGDILWNRAERSRCVLALCHYDRNGSEWRRDIYWLDFLWSNQHFVVVS